MAKMFYTLEEAAEKLGKSEDEVREMAKSGRVQEFRDRDKLMFKVEQIDLLAGDEESTGGGGEDDEEMIPLALDEGGDDDGDEEGGGLSLEESGTGGGLDLSELDSDENQPSAEPSASGSEFSLEESGSGSAFALEEGDAGGSGSGAGSRTGVSVFDADELDESDPGAVTQVQEQSLDEGDFQLDSVGSGSGLLDLTRESDDTSLGAEFLDEIYPGGEGEGGEEQAAGGEAPSTGLFEPSGAEEAGFGAAPAAAAPVEQIDGSGSGLAAGLSFGAVLALALALAVVITSMMGVTTGSITEMLADQFWIVVGAIGGVTVLGGLIGFVLGGRGG